MYACKSGKTEAAAVLLDHRAKIDATDEVSSEISELGMKHGAFTVLILSKSFSSTPFCFLFSSLLLLLLLLLLSKLDSIRHVKPKKLEKQNSFTQFFVHLTFSFFLTQEGKDCTDIGVFP